MLGLSGYERGQVSQVSEVSQVIPSEARGPASFGRWETLLDLIVMIKSEHIGGHFADEFPGGMAILGAFDGFCQMAQCLGCLALGIA